MNKGARAAVQAIIGEPGETPRVILCNWQSTWPKAANGRGLSVGYRATAPRGRGFFRQSDGKGGFQTKAIGSADDFDEANGENILDFWQAQEKVKFLALPEGARKLCPLKVSEAFDRYLPKLRAKNARSAKDTRGG
jgi:hypothetical protein